MQIFYNILTERHNTKDDILKKNKNMQLIH